MNRCAGVRRSGGAEAGGAAFASRNNAKSRASVTDGPGDQCARIAADEPRDQSLVDVAGGATGPPKIPIEAGDELHMNEHRLRWVALGACTFDVGADMRNERPTVEPSDCFERDE